VKLVDISKGIFQQEYVKKQKISRFRGKDEYKKR